MLSQDTHHSKLENQTTLLHLTFVMVFDHKLLKTFPPEQYRELMQRCWDADIANRPNMEELLLYFRDECQKAAESSDYGTQLVNQTSNFSSYETENISQSKVYKFNNLPIPRNATLSK